MNGDLNTKALILIPIISILLVGCGPSLEEKQEIATVTCNFILETRNMDSAIRMKAINEARDQIGEDKFLGRDSDIKESVQFNLCEELVLNDPNYRSKLSDSRNHFEDLREKAYLSEIRLAEKKSREAKERQQKWEEEQRKKEEKERIRKEIKKNEATSKFNDGVEEYFLKYPPKPKLNSWWVVINEHQSQISLRLFCSSLAGFDYKITIEYSNNLGSVSTYNRNSSIPCARAEEVARHNNIEVGYYWDEMVGGYVDVGKELSDKLWEIRQLPEEDQKNGLKSIIKNITLELTGTTSNTGIFYDWIPPNDRRMVQESTYMPEDEWIEDLKFTTRYEFQLYPDE